MYVLCAAVYVLEFDDIGMIKLLQKRDFILQHLQAWNWIFFDLDYFDSKLSISFETTALVDFACVTLSNHIFGSIDIISYGLSIISQKSKSLRRYKVSNWTCWSEFALLLFL